MKATERTGTPYTAHTFVTRGEQETGVLGRLLGELARPGDVIALAGPLGAGKTCLAQGIARGMGIIEPVPSPTFNLLLVHPSDLVMYHFDLYRLDTADQLEDIDLYATLEAGGVCVVEWADRFLSELPDDRLDVVLRSDGSSVREISLQPTGPSHARLAEACADAWRIAQGEEGDDA
jgi:tRNA threonylcarbamoyladenosine biosynthesis protein TsaE